MAVDGCGVRELDGVGPLSSLSSEIVSNFEGSSIGERKNKTYWKNNYKYKIDLKVINSFVIIKTVY